MERRVEKTLWSALAAGDVALVRRILEESAPLRCNEGGELLIAAAGDGNLAMVKMLVELGIDINVGSATSRGHFGPINSAAHSGACEIVRWLLDHGARIEQGENGQYGGTLIGAVISGSLDTVKLLIESGADIHVYYGNPPQNALSMAENFGHQHIAEYLRSLGAVEPPRDIPLPGDSRDDMVRQISEVAGPVDKLAIREMVPGQLSLAVHIIRPTERRPYLTLFTVGMSDLPLPVPDELAALRYCELLLLLPPDWPMNRSALQAARNRWPVKWLRKVAYYPHENKNWFGPSPLVIANGEPPKPLGPGVPFTSLLLLPERREFGDVTRGAAPIAFWLLVPLFTNERDFERQHGTVSLLRKFEDLGIDRMVDPNRRSAV